MQKNADISKNCRPCEMEQLLFCGFQIGGGRKHPPYGTRTIKFLGTDRVNKYSYNIYSYTHKHIHTYTHTHIHAHIYTYTYMYIYMYTHTHIYIYTHTYTHTYTYMSICPTLQFTSYS